MTPTIAAVRNERGGGLLMALLVLVALGAIVAGIVSAVSTERRVTSYNMTRSSALNYAEAGVAEALERIRSGDVPDNRSARMVSQIYLASPGSIPAVGTDTVAMATAQPAGQWLPYSSTTKGPNLLTVQYMTNATRTGIYFYDPAKSPPIQGKTGNPVFQIHSPAAYGLSKRTVDATVAQQTIQPNIKAAITSDDDVKLHGSVFALGYDYSADTPDGTGLGAVRNATYETGSNNVPGVWTTGKIDINSPSKAVGSPNTSASQSGFYNGPWDVLGMTQADFFNWVGPGLGDPKNGTQLPSGIMYMNYVGDKPGKGNHLFRFDGGSGDGLLYVNGDLQITGNFTYRGLIYVEGDLKIKGSGWILGAVVIHDHSKLSLSHHETLTVVKSSQAVTNFIARHRAPFTTLTWHEG